MNVQRTVLLSIIDRDPTQPRVDFDSDEAMQAAMALEDAIRQSGILQPILVRVNPADPDRYMIIDGERRYRAAQAIGLAEVPVFIREFADADRLGAQLFANLARRTLTVSEVGQSIVRLREMGYTGLAIAEKLGKTSGWVSKVEKFATSPQAIKLAEAGIITSPHTYAEFLGLSEQAQSALVQNAKDTKAPITRTKIKETAIQIQSELKKYDFDGLLENLEEESGTVVKRMGTEIQSMQIADMWTESNQRAPAGVLAFEVKTKPSDPRDRTRTLTRMQILSIVSRNHLIASYSLTFPESLSEDEIDGLVAQATQP